MFGCAALTSCCNLSPSPLFGLVEGDYCFQSSDGNLPPDWVFSESSYFTFARFGEEKDYDKHTIPPSGQWQMQKCVQYEDGKNEIYSNYRMTWHGTPFDRMKGMKSAGVAVQVDGTGVMSMRGSLDPDDDWASYSVLCLFFPLNRHDYSKRSIKINFALRASEPANKFSVTFSNANSLN